MSKNNQLDNASLSIEQALIWGDMDAYRHINNTVYYRYFEDVRIEYFEAVGINKEMAENNIGPILGESQCRFLKPLVYPDNITISARITTLREKRFTMTYQVYSQKMNVMVAEGVAEIVFVNYSEGTTCKIPDHIRQNIIELEPENSIEIISK